MTIPSTSIIILAAGNSSRLGTPKQLLCVKNKSFLRIMAEKAVKINPFETIAVLGFESDRMRQELEGLPIRVVLNQQWEEGIASSIRIGVNAVDSQADAALISLCDQPAVTPELLSELITLCSDEKPIAATKYNEILGVPACYGRSIFPELLLLQGDVGAKRVIAAQNDRVATCSFPDAAFDIDTLQDFQNPQFPNH
jgi:molybdenum cofactor cytidylyltransferase